MKKGKGRNTNPKQVEVKKGDTTQGHTRKGCIVDMIKQSQSGTQKLKYETETMRIKTCLLKTCFSR